MIYAKCIRGSQIVNSKEEFLKRQNLNENHVYCVGEETISKNDEEILFCVPLNCIFQCLKYGNYIAIIENEKLDYSKEYSGNAILARDSIASKKQTVVKILDPRNIEVIDFILKEVGDNSKILIGHASEENIGSVAYEYLKSKL
jgi:hypothetical protein